MTGPNACRMTARERVVYEIMVAAPTVDSTFRLIVANFVANTAASPDALFGLADAVDELAGQIRLSDRPPEIVTPEVTGLRSIAEIVRDHATARVAR